MMHECGPRRKKDRVIYSGNLSGVSWCRFSSKLAPLLRRRVAPPYEDQMAL